MQSLNSIQRSVVSHQRLVEKDSGCTGSRGVATLRLYKECAAQTRFSTTGVFFASIIG